VCPGMITYDQAYAFNRKHKLIKRVVECYKRADIPCGFACCGNAKLTNTKYYIPDADTLVKHKSLLFSENIIVLQSVLKEIKQKNVGTYNSYTRIIKRNNIFVFYDDFRLEEINEEQERTVLEGYNEMRVYEQKWPEKTARALSFYNSHVRGVIFSVLNRQTCLESADDPVIRDFIAVQDTQDDENYREYTNEGCVGFFHSSYYNYFSGTIYCGNTKYYVNNRLDVNRALNGDEVFFKTVESDDVTAEVLETDVNAGITQETGTIDTKKEKKVFAYVTGIKQRKDKIIIGTILNGTISGVGTQNVLVKPIDKKYPPCRIQTSNVERYKNMRLKIVISEWKETSKYPNAVYIGMLGPVGDVQTEINSILILNEISDTPLNQNYYEETEKFGHEQLNCEETRDMQHCMHINSDRLDLRNEDVFSIDPPGCTDIDDALHCKIGTTTEIGVHIADVSSYVPRNTAVDEEAKRRGTTVYLNDRRIDMLPEVLSSDLCSLKSNVDRLALSVIFQFDADFNIIGSKVCETIVKSREAFTYDQAQNILDCDKDHVLYAPLRRLYDVSRKLRKSRIDNGALILNSKEIFVRRNRNGKEIKGRCTQENEIHRANGDVNLSIDDKSEVETCSVIEEFMILANVTVAKFMYEHIKNCSLLRRHPEVEMKEIESEIESVRSMLKRRSMAQATYFSSGTVAFADFKHFGLAEPIYTHFTSPIRRYADLVVHRLVKSVLFRTDYGYDDYSIDALTKHLNVKHRSAQIASRECNFMFLYFYLRERECVTQAYVIKSLANGSIVYVPEYDLDGFIKSVRTVNEEVKVRIVRDDENFFINRWIKLEEVVQVKK
ncbi:Exosomal 3'-5' exoribonuclease complex, subunit Rrp44/Dis3, partial [Trachipleistophora hominis]